MLNIITKLAMVSSFAVFTLFYLDDWVGHFLGMHNHIWILLDLPQQSELAPRWIVVVGSILGAASLACLFFAYRAVWMILSKGSQQDFRNLARYLQQLAFGLIGYWLMINISFWALRTLLGQYVTSGEEIDWYWDPFNPDIVLAIVAVAIFAIAKMMERAWRAEDEVQHFL